MKLNLTKTLLERFSCSLVGRGKKIVGHKILLESLFLLREKNKKTFLSLDAQKNQFEKTRANLLAFTLLQSNKKTITSHKLHSSYDFTSVFPYLPLYKSKISKNADYELAKQKQHKGKKHKVTKVSTPSCSPLTLMATFNTKKNELLSRNKILYNTFDMLTDFFTEKNNLVCQLCVDRVKVVLETRKVRKGRITYRVPLISSPRRQEGKAISLLIDNANSRDSKSSVISSNYKLTDVALLSRLSRTSRLDLSCFHFAKKKAQIANQGITKDLHPHANLRFVKEKACKRFTAAKMVQQQNDSCIKKEQRKSVLLSNLSVNKQFTNEAKRLKKKSWFLDSYSNSRLVYSIKNSLAEEFFDCINAKSASVERKKQLHAFALQNRASLHFRWW